MASHTPSRTPTPHRNGIPPEPFRYESRRPSRVPADRTDNAEARLGPYETSYLIEMGYSAPPRPVG